MSGSRRHGPPPIPLLYQGSLLSDEEFKEAYCSLGDYLILEALDDGSKLLGYAIGKITRLYALEDNGAHLKLDYIGAENDFYRWYIDHMDGPEVVFNHSFLSGLWLCTDMSGNMRLILMFSNCKQWSTR